VTTERIVTIERRIEFQAVLDAWAEAIVANDSTRIASFAAPDWIIVTPEGGPGHLEGFLGFVASGDLVHDAMTFEVLDVRTSGGCAIVIAHGTNGGTWQGEPFTADEWVTDVFVRGAAGWRCTVSALTPNYAAVRRPA
jgi:ketosteroid isomerase-like protein